MDDPLEVAPDCGEGSFGPRLSPLSWDPLLELGFVPPGTWRNPLADLTGVVGAALFTEFCGENSKRRQYWIGLAISLSSSPKGSELALISSL